MGKIGFSWESLPPRFATTIISSIQSESPKHDLKTVLPLIIGLNELKYSWHEINSDLNFIFKEIIHSHFTSGSIEKKDENKEFLYFLEVIQYLKNNNFVWKDFPMSTQKYFENHITKGIQSRQILVDILSR